MIESGDTLSWSGFTAPEVISLQSEQFFYWLRIASGSGGLPICPGAKRHSNGFPKAKSDRDGWPEGLLEYDSESSGRGMTHRNPIGQIRRTSQAAVMGKKTAQSAVPAATAALLDTSSRIGASIR